MMLRHAHIERDALNGFFPYGLLPNDFWRSWPFVWANVDERPVIGRTTGEEQGQQEAHTAMVVQRIGKVQCQ